MPPAGDKKKVEEELKKLDGEFAIVIADFNLNKIYFIHDAEQLLIL